ncbi:MAG: MFS transporter [Chloroflexota bacterium]|nr:MAG: MFS transporter [Chloroflexota bacterium]
MRLLGSLRIRPFATLWGGQTVSRFGDAVHQIALAWLVLELTGSAAAMGAVLAAHVLPFIAFSLVGGVVVDRVPRLRVMLASDLARMVIVAVIAGLVILERVEFWHLIVLAAMFGAVEAFFYPAYWAAVPELVPTDLRPSANSLHQLSRRFARLLGPALGAVLVAGGGTGFAFVLDSVSYLVSAVLVVLAMRVRARTMEPAALGDALAAAASDTAAPGDPVTPGVLIAPGAAMAPVAGGIRATTRSALTDLREGLATVTGEPWIWIAIVAAGVTGVTLAGPLEAGLPLLVSEHLGGGVAVLGLIQTMISVGAIGAAVILGSQARLRRRGPVLYGAWITFAICVALAGLPVGIPGVALLGVVIGACGATVGLVWINTLQDLVPAEQLGRVSSIDALGSTALEPIGLVVAGVAADAWGPATVFTIGGLTSAAILSLALLSPSVRRLD